MLHAVYKLKEPWNDGYNLTWAFSKTQLVRCHQFSQRYCSFPRNSKWTLRRTLVTHTSTYSCGQKSPQCLLKTSTWSFKLKHITINSAYARGIRQQSCSTFIKQRNSHYQPKKNKKIDVRFALTIDTMDSKYYIGADRVLKHLRIALPYRPNKLPISVIKWPRHCFNWIALLLNFLWAST